MNHLIICALAVATLNSFGAAGPELAQLSKEAAKSDALRRLITVTPGASKTPFCLAYRPVGRRAMHACLVASSKLHDSISPDVAQVLVDAVPTHGGRLSYSSLKMSPHMYENIVHKKIVEGAVSKEVLSGLIAFYVLNWNKGALDYPVVATYRFGNKYFEYVERSESNGFKKLKYSKSDVDVVINYDACVEYFPKPDDCSIL